MRPFREHSLLASLVAYVAAGFAHNVHNAEYLGDYPGMPRWLSPMLVYGGWLAATAVGFAGYALFQRGSRILGGALIALYAAYGLYSLGHYAVAPFSAHTTAMNVTILLDVGTALFLLLSLAWTARSS